MHTHTYSCTCKHHVCTPTHTRMHRSHALCSYMYVCAHTSTHVQSHILCAHMQEFVCAYKHPAHRRACPHVRTRSCTHPPMRWHTCAHPHTHTCLWPRSPSQLQAGCISGAPARAALPGVGLASTSPPRPLREPFCPCLPWTWGSVTGPSPGWQLCPSILRALLFLQNMRLEIPPREACLLSPAGWRGARFTGLLCAPRGTPSSDLISAMGSCGWATSQSLCLGQASLSSRWKHAGGMGGPRGLVTSILPSHTGCRWGRPYGWRSAEHSSTSPRARPGLPARRALLGSILWRSWIYAPAYPPYLLSGSPRTSCLPWPLFSHLSSGAIDWMV